MSTAIAKTDTARGLAAFSGNSNPFLDDANRSGADAASAYIAFSGNTGKWTFKGQEIDVGTILAFDLWNAARGWIAWKNNKPVEKISVPILDNLPLPSEDELTDHWDGAPAGKRPKETDGWREVVIVNVRNLDGGPPMELSLPGSPGYRPINRLIKEFGAKVRANIDDAGEPMIPLVEIDAESFDGRGGKKYAPILRLTDWMSRAELDGIAVTEGVEEAVAPAPAPAPAPARPAPAAAANRPIGRRV